MRRLNVILVVVASIATLVLVIEAIDWMITSDEEVIAAANEHGLVMLFTGMRHFWH